METFINAAVTTGIKNYVLMTHNEQYSKAHIFEVHVIDMLAHIYCEINVINYNIIFSKYSLYLYNFCRTNIDILLSTIIPQF